MPKKIKVNFNFGSEPASRFQIYPTEDLARRIEKYKKDHPSRMTMSGLICVLLHERLEQIELAARASK